MQLLKSSVLCFCTSRCIEMFKVISHTGAQSDIDKKNQQLLGIPERYPSYNPGFFFRCNEMHAEFHVFRAIIRMRGFHWLSYA